MPTILIIVCAFECTFEICTNWDISYEIDSYMSDKKAITKIIDGVRDSDNDLYRIEKTDSLTLNDPAWYGYTGVSTFSSMAYENVSITQRMLGMPGNNINSYYYKGVQTPVYNTIFDVKYLIGDNANDDQYNITKVGDYYLNEYLYPSSFVYAVNKEIKDLELKGYLPFDNQSNFVLSATGIENVYTPLEVTCTEDGVTAYDVNRNGEFVYYFDEDRENITVNIKTIPNKPVYLYVKGSLSGYQVDSSYYSLTSDEYYTVDIGKVESDSIDVRADLIETKNGSLTVYAYTINEAAFKEFYNKIIVGALKVEKYSDTLIEGTIKASKDQIVFSSIAYDKGFTVYVDGKKVKTYKVLDAYMI